MVLNATDRDGVQSKVVNEGQPSKYLNAITINHNTPDYTELMLRSFFSTHGSSLDINVKVVDNDSKKSFLLYLSCMQNPLN